MKNPNTILYFCFLQFLLFCYIITIWNTIKNFFKELAVHIPHCGNIISKENEEKLEAVLNDLKDIQSSMNESLEKFINNYINEKETMGLRRFKLIFKKNNSGEFKTNYMSFMRLGDRKISEQKEDLKNLLEDNIDKKILNALPSVNFDVKTFEGDLFIADFFTDGKEIYDLEVLVTGKN